LKKILFFLPSSVTGKKQLMGTEKNAITIINNINREKYELSVAIMKVKENLNRISLNKENIHNLDSSRALFSFYRCYKIINKVKPDIVFSFMHHVNIMVIATRLFNPEVKKFIARESNIPSLDNEELKYSKIHKLLYKLFYKYYDVIICQSKEMQSDILSYASIPIEKTIVIPNAIDVGKIQESLKDAPDTYNNKWINILAVGRLTYQKGFDMLLNAFSLIKLDNFHLTIIGIGPDEEKLRSLSNKLKISNKVTFLGFQNQTYKYMKHADIFSLPSRYEGFPNVVLESCASGLPVVAFNCPGGIDEIIDDGLNGFKVMPGNIESFAKNLIKASKTKFNSNKIIDSIKTKFDLKKIINQYEEILDLE